MPEYGFIVVRAERPDMDKYERMVRQHAERVLSELALPTSGYQLVGPTATPLYDEHNQYVGLAYSHGWYYDSDHPELPPTSRPTD